MKLIFKTPCLIVLLSLGIAAHAVALDFAIVHVVSGCAKQASGDLDGALAEFKRAIEIDPNDAKAYYYRGRVKQAKGDQERTLADYDRTIALDPNHAFAYNNRGNAKKAKGDMEGAIADFDHAIELDSKSARAYSNRGFAKKVRGDLNGAVADFTRAIELDPKYAEGYNDLAWLSATAPNSSLRNGAKAVEYATKACELTQWKDVRIIDTLAAANAENGDFDQVIKWENKYLGSNPSNKKDVEGAQSRLALYQKHQPYHEAPK